MELKEVTAKAQGAMCTQVVNHLRWWVLRKERRTGLDARLSNELLKSMVSR